VLWSYPAPLPDWWNDLPTDRPLVYVTLGSSGDAGLLPAVLAALGDLPLTVLANTAGRICVSNPPPNCRLADFLPGAEASGRASLVICNGGSLATYQALATGVPVLGIATNMDQLMNMAYIEQAGAGRRLRASEASIPRVAALVRDLTERPATTERAQTLGKAIRACDPARALATLLETL
jgi:UDP:flavonoid glycosyltransferase YjiC (YdhE family)